MNLKKRRVLITGGSSGIGLALGLGLADDNSVVLTSHDPAKLERAASAKPGLRAVSLDVTSEEQSRAAIGG